MRHVYALALAITLGPGIGFAADAKLPAGYDVQLIKGFTVLVPDDVRKAPADRWQRKPLQVLENDLDDLRRIVGPKHIALVTQVPIWVNWHAIDRSAPEVVAVYYRDAAKELIRFGQQPLKNNCIEVLSLKRLGEIRPPGSAFQQVVLLHEMAHAVQHRLLGSNAPEVDAAFNQAVERKLYDEVSDRFGQRRRAYARINAAEYFAELSCAYLDSCHFFPFAYADLKEYDPIGFALMESVWKRPEQFAGRTRRVEAAKFATSSTINSVNRETPNGIAAEQAAFKVLDQARAHWREGKTDDARNLLINIVQNHPTTYAAVDARKMLGLLR